ncbi:MAG: FadR/GntR family transcriptional regulator [Lachnospiraceae bacterium]
MQSALYNNVLEDLLKDISEGKLAENDKLPSERELSVNYGVSRNVVREAIKILSEKNLIINIPGKGNYISKPTSSNIADKLEDALDLSNVSAKDIIDAREFLEINLIDMYLPLITEEDIIALENLYAQMEKSRNNFGEFSKYDTEFHLYLVGCTRNSIIKIFHASLFNMTKKNFILESPDPANAIRSSQQVHGEIIEAIKSKNQEMLTEALKKHLAPLHDFYNE